MTKVADEAWVSAITLIRQRQTWDGVPVADIVKHASKEFYAGGRPRVGVYQHAVQHSVANKPNNSGGKGYRMLIANGQLRRPFIPGDPCDSERKGKITPRTEDLPSKYHELLDWYANEYVPRRSGQVATKALASVESPIRILTKTAVSSSIQEANLLAISHEVLRLRSVNATPRLLLIETGLVEAGRGWLARHRDLAADVRLMELLPDGNTRPLEEHVRARAVA